MSDGDDPVIEGHEDGLYAPESIERSPPMTEPSETGTEPLCPECAKHEVGDVCYCKVHIDLPGGRAARSVKAGKALDVLLNEYGFYERQAGRADERASHGGGGADYDADADKATGMASDALKRLRAALRSAAPKEEEG